MAKLDTFKEATAPLPSSYKGWQIFGAGMENVGKNGQMSELELRPPKDNEVLLRIDALGICLSDIKIITQGSNHARLRGRDLATDPTILGHECAVTIVDVGEQWKDMFQPGERYIVQADIYYQGQGFAFGYLIPGGMAQYAYLDERALAGDEGCYLLPVREETGYSQAALAEPWACVEMSYNLEERLQPGGNRILIVSDDAAKWHQDYPMAEVVSSALEEVAEGALYSDIILTSPTSALVNTLSEHLDVNGVMFLLGKPQDNDLVSLDVGKIHYQGHRYFGGGDTLEEIAAAHRRNDLLTGGKALFIGAGGPMGQMHVQRSIEKAEGPKTVIVTDLDRGRLDHIEARFRGLAESRGITLRTFAPSDFADQAMFNEEIKSWGGPDGYSDIAIMAPIAGLVPQVMPWAADGAFINVFAGVVIGSKADFHLKDLCRGITIIGSSGSRISDLRKVLSMIESGELNTNLSVAAIGGLDAARDGLQAVKEARFPGKTVIYTQVEHLPLTALEDVPARFPKLQPYLSPEGAWTKEAEQALLEEYL
ncbi:MAG: alcohol dehydrogenase catalytic domain-containing protein [Candidatus Hydrogenedentes bacterium]|nr:alcohol dehydrogenase catalytic domain-containing protein [Candidatus Hydrogenedentota bacterium]